MRPVTHAAETHADREMGSLADEQAALRRVATLVAGGAPADDVFSAVASEVAHLFRVPAVMLARYGSDRTTTVLASVGEPSLEVDFSELSGALAADVRDSLPGGVGCPIVVDGKLWGVIAIETRDSNRIPVDAEARLAAFSDLVALSISNAESRESLRRLADEYAALHRVSALVAGAASPEEVCTAVAEEVSWLLGLSRVEMVRYESDKTATVIGASGDHPFAPGSQWALDGPSIMKAVVETGRQARIDDFADLSGTIAEVARSAGFRSAIGAPIVVDGRTWGAIIAISTRPERIAEGSETRLSLFTEILATAVSNLQAHDDLRELATQQTALRRVAMLVAAGASDEKLFAAVAQEVARVLDNPVTTLLRYEAGRTMTVLASENDPTFPPGSRWSLDGTSVTATVLDTGRPARIDDYSDLTGTLAEATRRSAITASVGVPVLVDGTVWGMLAASATTEPLPVGIENRLYEFSELLATAISNTAARDRIRRLADEQAALRRLATLVAEGASSQAVFDAVCAETGRLVGAASANLSHYTAEGFNVTMAGWSLRETHVPVGARFPVTADTLGGSIVRTHAPARVDSWDDATSELASVVRERGIRSSLGAPVVVEGQLWGALVAATDEQEPFPAGTEFRLARFTDLIATAISNTEARDSISRLAAEQTALRHVATLVAEGATAEELFSAVATEVAQVLHVSGAILDKFDSDGLAVTLAVSHDADWEEADQIAYPGKRWPRDPGSLSALVYETRRAARVDDYSNLEGSVGDDARAVRAGSGCAAPIIVDGKLWGLIRVFSRRGASLPAGIEDRLHAFTELVATALSNASARADLIASRARIVAAGDEARRRIERNLHDGTQQRLIALGLDLQRIRGSLPEDQAAARSGLDEVEADLAAILEEVRELSRGLHPPLLARRGLQPSLRALARRSPIPVAIEVDLQERPPAQIETALYYVAAEALTNAIRHSRASSISVRIALEPREAAPELHATIADDGIGGAAAAEGSGLPGLADRVDALGGRFSIDSPPGQGTRISVVLPGRSPAAP